MSLEKAADCKSIARRINLSNQTYKSHAGEVIKLKNSKQNIMQNDPNDWKADQPNWGVGKRPEADVTILGESKSGKLNSPKHDDDDDDDTYAPEQTVPNINYWASHHALQPDLK